MKEKVFLKAFFCEKNFEEKFFLKVERGMGKEMWMELLLKEDCW